MATNNANSDIEILVGVQGGEDINDGSGAIIARTLKKIAQNISNANLIKVKIDADPISTKKSLQKTLNQAGLKIHNVSFGNNIANALQNQLNQYKTSLTIGDVSFGNDIATVLQNQLNQLNLSVNINGNASNTNGNSKGGGNNSGGKGGGKKTEQDRLAQNWIKINEAIHDAGESGKEFFDQAEKQTYANNENVKNASRQILDLNTQMLSLAELPDAFTHDGQAFDKSGIIADYKSLIETQIDFAARTEKVSDVELEQYDRRLKKFNQFVKNFIDGHKKMERAGSPGRDPSSKKADTAADRWELSLAKTKANYGDDIMQAESVAKAWEKAKEAVQKYRDGVTKADDFDAVGEIYAAIRAVEEAAKAQKKYVESHSGIGMDKVVAKSNLEFQSFEKYLRTLSPKALTEFSAEIRNIRNLLREDTPEAFEKAKVALTDFKANMKRFGYESGNIFTMLEGKIKTFATYLVSSRVVDEFFAQFSRAVQTVIELDDALTDLRIVTGGTNAETKELLKTYNQMAQKIGSTTSETSQAAVSWLRQGYNIADTNQLIETSMVFSKVGFLEANEAASTLTSTMLGYKLSVDEAMTAVDMFTKLDLDMATSAGDIAIALAQTASMAESAGISLAKVSAQLATVLSVTQESGEVVGNFYKSTLSRLQNIRAGRLEDPETGESLKSWGVAA